MVDLDSNQSTKGGGGGGSYVVVHNQMVNGPREQDRGVLLSFDNLSFDNNMP